VLDNHHSPESLDQSAVSHAAICGRAHLSAIPGLNLDPVSLHAGMDAEFGCDLTLHRPVERAVRSDRLNL
jgi:hypothetical protein